ncbi:GntR family transcriptional regulator, partial [Streptomyces clavuligerus]
MPSEKTFAKIADHFRERILSGELAPGSRLPTNREISGQWQVAAATVSRALQALQVEHFIRTTPRGTYVSDDPR